MFMACLFPLMETALERWDISTQQTEENCMLVRWLLRRLAKLEISQASTATLQEQPSLLGMILCNRVKYYWLMRCSYLDLYLSTTPGSPYFFGDKSIVIHSSNTTRLTCANFTMVASGGSSTSSSMPSSTSSPAMYTGAASRMSTSVLGGVAAMAMGFML